jgi:ABC-type uncharacterized transport system substrate-binding protein
MFGMRRREFVSLLGGATAWPLAARAQQPVEVRRIGYLTTLSEKDRLEEGHLATFRKALDDWGWREGRNLHIDYRQAAGDADRLRAFAKELIGLQPDVIFAVTTPAVAVLLRETRTLPIVFAQVHLRVFILSLKLLKRKHHENAQYGDAANARLDRSSVVSLRTGRRRERSQTPTGH